MSNYTPITTFTTKDALVSGNPLKLLRGSEFDAEFAAIATAIATKLDSTSAANPTGTIGLTAVNGILSTYMRSDAAPALSQAIAPTWTATHTFTPASGRAITANGVANQYTAFFSGNSTAGQSFGIGIRAGTTVADLAIDVANQAGTKNFLTILGNGNTSFGNATDNPSFTFVGTGALTFGGVALHAAGSVGSPSVSFGGDPNSGFYSFAGDSIGLSTNGTFRGYWDTSIHLLRLQFQGQDGSVGAPGVSWENDPDSGIYRVGANNWRASAGNLDIVGFANAAGTAIMQPFGVVNAVSNGTAGAPVYSWNSDSTSGLYRIGAGNLGMSAANSLVMDWLAAASGGARVADYGGTLQPVGYRHVPQNAQTANYTLVLADSGKHIHHASGAGAGDTYTIPANSSVAYDIGTVLTFTNLDSNNLSIAITTDTMRLAGSGATGTRTLAQYGIATAMKIAATEWLISGTNLT